MTWLMFDYGGVICGDLTAEDRLAYERLAGAGLWAPYWAYRLAYDRGDLDAVAYWSNVATDLGRSWDADRIGELVLLDVRAWRTFRPGIMELLELAARHHRLALLSNAPQPIADALRASRLAELFDPLLFSCEFRLIKPDPECFRYALDRLNAAPDEVIFVDDRERNVKAARALGIRAIHFTDERSLRADLAALLA